ncbi:hypothetical protein ON010_g6785 [Phytophthora cinnamomi]|nr:hypothetical protein ON010_g6785 [Phytophthora cinnamomi]
MPDTNNGAFILDITRKRLSLAETNRKHGDAHLRVKGNTFPVDIEESQLVGHLKDAIRENPECGFPKSKLELFLAKKGDGTWLDRDGAEAVTLDEHGHPEGFTHMDPLLWINNPKNFGDNFEPNEGEIHVLVVVPEGATSEHDSLSLLREASVRQMRLEMQLEQLVASLPHKQTKSYSDATLGQLELGRLKKDNLIIDAAPIGDGEAFWSKEVQIQADAITNEAVFDAFITPFFSTILHSCGLVFVNSERYQWLSQSTLVTKNTDLKPDGFATHRGMFRGKPVPNDGVLRPSGFRFGAAAEELFDCLILFESKLTIIEAAFGQVFKKRCGPTLARKHCFRTSLPTTYLRG